MFKKITICAVLVMIPLVSLSQQNKPVPAQRISKEKLIQISEREKAAYKKNMELYYEQARLETEKRGYSLNLKIRDWMRMNRNSEGRDYCSAWIMHKYSDQKLTDKISDDIRENGLEKYVQRCVEMLDNAIDEFRRHPSSIRLPREFPLESQLHVLASGERWLLK